MGPATRPYDMGLRFRVGMRFVYLLKMDLDNFDVAVKYEMLNKAILSLMETVNLLGKVKKKKV